MARSMKRKTGPTTRLGDPEAGATGLPVVATEVGGNREIVLDGKSGLLAPPGDTAALARAMGLMMDLPEADRRQMGENNRGHVEAVYSFEKVVDAWEHLYRELLTKKEHGTA